MAMPVVKKDLYQHVCLLRQYYEVFGKLSNIMFGKRGHICFLLFGYTYSFFEFFPYRVPSFCITLSVMFLV